MHTEANRQENTHTLSNTHMGQCMGRTGRKTHTLMGECMGRTAPVRASPLHLTLVHYACRPALDELYVLSCGSSEQSWLHITNPNAVGMKANH